MAPHHKTVRRVHQPGDCHEMTFSCDRRLPLLTNDDRRRTLAESVDRAVRGHDFRLVAFVFMPEHVHLLVDPTTHEPRLDLLLKAIKRPFSFRVKQALAAARDPLLGELTVRERPEVERFRFWQEGGGYDRNLWTEPAVLASIDDIHRNPVRRGLCERATQRRWSSAGHYETRDSASHSGPPEVSGLPAGFFARPDS